jgi:DNA-binding CsgD family transcriptional regulator
MQTANLAPVDSSINTVIPRHVAFAAAPVPLHLPAAGDPLDRPQFRPLLAERPAAVVYLTPREREVLSWVALGKSDWQIAQILLISHKTVNFHVERAKRRLNVGTRVQAAIIAHSHGLLDPAPVLQTLDTEH